MSGSLEDSWREWPHQQRWRRTSQGEGPYEDRDPDRDRNQEAFSEGKRWKNRNRKKTFEEHRGSEESNLSAKDLRQQLQAEKRLNKEEIYPVKKRPHVNSGALYTCALCDILLESLAHAFRHIRDKRHKKKAKEKLEQVMLIEIRPPGPQQASAVTAALEAEVAQHGLSDEDVEQRRCVVAAMQDLLLSVLPEIRLRLYGSSCTKFGFTDSDVNIDIQYPQHVSSSACLRFALFITLFVDVEADFHARVPVVLCKDRSSGLICKVSAGNENAFQTTAYLAALCTAEPLVRPLVLGLRRWARLCTIDRSEEGGLPPYVFALMVIYFLQQRKVSILPTYLKQEIREFSLSRLSDFHLTLGVTLGLLWVEMLRFYSLEFNMAENVICVRTAVVLSREMKDWPKKRIAVEDPFAVKRNVARTVNSQQMYEYILHCLKTTYKYFALPPNAPAGPKAIGLVSDFNQLSVQSQPADHKPEENGPEDSDCIIEEEEDDEEDEDVESRNRRHLDSFTTEEEEIFPVDEISGEELLSDEEGPDLDTAETQTRKEKKLSYEFSKQAFSRGKTHMVVCSLCKHDGHLKKDCPEDFKKVQLDPLPALTPEFLSVLNKVCEQCYTDFAPDELEMGVRELILKDLETFIKRQFPAAQLQLFGSSKNGFGFRQSDLDICMVLEGQETINDVDCISLIESLARLLRKHSGVKNVLPITTAKVPIVKFYHVQTGLEGDISLYNTLVEPLLYF
uniref:CCHC-type domain-containing protein n=1 Tax=Takifugu rubripes TaxID=31033 RepID=A0A674NRY5_TAKRU